MRLVLFLILILGGCGIPPCLKYGPEYPYVIYQKVGPVWIPIISTTRDCLVREGDK